MTKELINISSEEDTQMANQHMKRGSTSLVIRKKLTMRKHSTPTRMAAMEKGGNNKSDKNVEKLEPS